MDFAMSPLTPEQIDHLARKRAGAKMGWYIHATVYLVVNAMLVLVALSSGRGHWPVFPIFGWGIGLALHGAAVFLFGSGSDLREKLVERERRRLQQAQESRDPW